MRDISDHSVDLILCDLPYGCLTSGQPDGLCSWDVKLDLEAFWKEVKRIRRDDHSPCIQFCSTKFGADLITSNPKEFRYDLVWDKQRGVSFLSANKMPMRSHEMIYVFSKKGAYYKRVDISGDFVEWAKDPNNPNDVVRRQQVYSQEVTRKAFSGTAWKALPSFCCKR